MSAKKAAAKKVVKSQAAKKKAAAPVAVKQRAVKKRRAAKKKKAPAAKTDSVTGDRFNGMKLCFAGKPGRYGETVATFQKWARADGATTSSTVGASTDLLIVLDKGATAAAKKLAKALNAKSAAIQEISESEFLEMFRPTANEVISLLKSGKTGTERLNALIERSQLTHYQWRECIDLRGSDLRGFDLSDLNLTWAALDGADLRGVVIDATELTDLKNVRLENAKGPYFRFETMSHCQCKGAELPHLFAGWQSYGKQKAIQHCDFSAANLDDAYCNYCTIESTSFKKAVLTKTDIANSKLISVDCSQADFTKANLASTTCTGCSFAKAKFVSAKLQDLDFGDADLTGADFTNAILVGAKLSGAKLAGAKFDGAVVAGADFGAADISKTKGLNLSSAQSGIAGKSCRELAAAAKKAAEISVDVLITAPEGKVRAQIYMSAGLQTLRFSLTLADKSLSDDDISYWSRMPSVGKAFERLGQLWAHGELDYGQLKVSTKRSDLKGKALKELVTSALSEVFGVAPPSEDDVKAQQKSAKQAKADLKVELAAELRGGKAGIKKFNSRKTDKHDYTEFDIRKEDFSGLSLPGVKSNHVNFQGSNFESAKLIRAKLESCNFRDCNFKNANLGSANLSWSRFTNSDLSGANLAKANLEDATLDRANLSGVDATGVKFIDGSILGSNFKDAKLKGTKWRGCAFDDQTVFPKGFTLPEEMEYKGKGHDPRHVVDHAALSQVLDFDSFMDRLNGSVDQSRLKKSLKMLKADRFELFSEVDDKAFVGVVKSQTDPDLVYSCRLTATGEFACCTQNLNPCGGLRGALCKHLLVLIVGVTKGGQLDAQTAATWADASNACKPNLDKDVMSEVLLKYKGAEAGEVDWRPIETIPEDYYAF